MTPDDQLWDRMSTALDYLAEEVSFGSDTPLLVYDPADASRLPDELTLDGEPWQWLQTGSSNALLFDGIGEGEGPYVWVFRTSDGPLDKIVIRQDLTPVIEQAEEFIGTLTTRSGRLGLAWPRDARAWGADLAPTHGQDARVETHRPGTEEEFPGTALAVQLPRPAECGVYAHRTDGRLVAIDIILPRPGWAESYRG